MACSVPSLCFGGPPIDGYDRRLIEGAQRDAAAHWNDRPGARIVGVPGTSRCLSVAGRTTAFRGQRSFALGEPLGLGALGCRCRVATHDPTMAGC